MADTVAARSYSLQGRNLKLTTREEAKPYVDELEAVEDLEEIHLGGNTLGIEACQAFGEVLSKKKTLKVADFADIFTGRLISEIPTALRALCDSLVSHENLEEIDLSDNAFGGRSSEPMVNLLSNNHAISIVKLNNNGLGPQGGTIVADALFDAAKKIKAKGQTSKLKTLVCSRNRLEDGSSKAWARSFAAHGTLQEVRMYQNGIRMDGIERIVRDGLAHCPDLREVNFNDNTALLKGGKAIADLLPSWTKLRVLHLGDCLVRSKGAAEVLGALAKGQNSELEELHLAYNEVDRAGLDKLGALLEEDKLPAIKLIDINGNFANEDDECVERIKAALAKTGKEDVLGDLDEMEPDGEEEEDEEEDEEEEEGEDEDDKEEEGEEKEDHKIEDAAAAAVAVPAATAAVVGAAAAGAVSESGIEDKLASLSVGKNKKDDETAEDEPKEASAAATTTSAQEDKQAAQTAAEVAETAEEVPEEKQGADVAAEVAESAKEVPEEKEGADVAADVAQSANEVPEEKEGAEVAAQVSQSAEVVDAKEEVVAAPEAVNRVDPNTGAPEKGLSSQDKSLSGETSAGVEGAAAAGALGAGAVAAAIATAGSTTGDAVDANSTAAKTSTTDASHQEAATEAKESAKVDAAAAPVAAALPVDKALASDTPAAIESTTTTAASTEVKDKQMDSLADQLQEATLTGPEKMQAEAPDTSAAPAAASVAAAAPAATRERRAQQGSVDLSGELYGQESSRAATSSAANAEPSTSVPAASKKENEEEEQQAQETPKKKRGFRAAMGAVRELLRG